MAAVLSPSAPRRPLAALPINITLTPNKLSSTKANQSPIKPGTPVTPALFLSSKKPIGTAVPALNQSKKRPIDEVLAVDGDETRVSFSSLINFDPSSDGLDGTTQFSSSGRTTTIDVCLHM